MHAESEGLVVKKVYFAELLWGESDVQYVFDLLSDEGEGLDDPSRGFDFVVASDCVYNDSIVPQLLTTITSILSASDARKNAERMEGSSEVIGAAMGGDGDDQQNSPHPPINATRLVIVQELRSEDVHAGLIEMMLEGGLETNDKVGFSLEFATPATLIGIQQYSLAINIASGVTSPSVVCSVVTSATSSRCINRSLNIARRECMNIDCSNAVLAPDLLDGSGIYEVTADWCLSGPLGKTQCQTIDGGNVQINAVAANIPPVAATNTVRSTSSARTTVSAPTSTSSTSNQPKNNGGSSNGGNVNVPGGSGATTANRNVVSPTGSTSDQAISGGQPADSNSKSALPLTLIVVGSVVGVVLLVVGTVMYQRSVAQARKKRSAEVAHYLYSAGNNGGLPKKSNTLPESLADPKGPQPTLPNMSSIANAILTRIGSVRGPPTPPKQGMASTKYPSNSRDNGYQVVPPPIHRGSDASTATYYPQQPSQQQRGSDASNTTYYPQHAPVADNATNSDLSVYTYDPYMGGYAYPGGASGYPTPVAGSTVGVPGSEVPYDAQVANNMGYAYPYGYTDPQYNNYPGYYDENGQYHWYNNEQQQAYGYATAEPVPPPEQSTAVTIPEHSEVKEHSHEPLQDGEGTIGRGDGKPTDK
ncbi:hypothetical protein HDU97_009162 [Phlyctochytrium planicorne]|nr:hypothetical protein HDU97_009162 [Phlyctochytrium planicorne]